MQDNQMPPELGSAFEDRAWEDMRQLLDKEMPVRKEKRRLIWWWWGGLVAVGLVVFIGLFVSTSTSKRENIAPKQIIVSDKIINHQEKIAVEQENRLLEDKIDPSSIIASSEQMLKSETSKNTSIKLPFPSTEPIKNEVSEGKIATILQGTALPLDNTISSLSTLHRVTTEEINTPVTTVFSTLEVITHEEVISSPLVANSDTSTGFSKIFSYNDFPVLPIMSAPLLEIPPIYPLLNTLITPLSSKWKWGITATIGTFKLTRVNEYGIGLFASYQSISKWQFQTGLTYHFLRLNLLSTSTPTKNQNILDALGVEADTDDSGSISTGPVLPPSTTSENQDTSIRRPEVPDTTATPLLQDVSSILGVGGVHYLSIPLRVDYQLSSNFSVGAGTTMYYALHDSYDSIGEEGASLRRLDLTSSIGATYQVHPRIQVQLNYERGWFQNREKLRADFTTLSGLDGRYSPFSGRIRLSGSYAF